MAVSAKVQGWVWDLPELLPQRRLILLWLANRATDNGVCFPGQAEVRRKTSLGEKMVRRHLHWLASDRDDDGQQKPALVTIVERRIDTDRNTSNVYVLHVPWARPDQVARQLEELRHVPADALSAIQGEGAAGDPLGPDGAIPEHRGGGRGRPPGGSPAGGMGVTGDREETGHPDNHRTRVSPPDPPPPGSDTKQRQQQQGESEGSASNPPGPCAPPGQLDAAAEALVVAFYRGLDADPAAATLAIRRRDQAIARQLLEAGATPVEAEAYAREMAAVAGRLAPVDLRSFERERLSWRAQRRGSSTPRLAGLRLVTGQELTD